jgi:hypothetical protein
MEIPAVKAINAGDPPTIEFDTLPAKGSWCPGKSPGRFGPSPESSRLGPFIPRLFHLSLFLSSEFIIIGMVMRSPMTSFHLFGYSGLLARTPLFCVFKKTTCWPASPNMCATIAVDDVDATMTMSWQHL